MVAFRHLDSDSVGPGAVIARITRYGNQQRATVRQVEKATELGDVHPSEEMPVEDTLRLARHRVVDTEGDEILVELETGTSWQDEWGRLT